jgi:hypothetical protein
MENVNGALFSSGLAWYSFVVASHARIFGAMVSPESSTFAIGGGAGCFVMAEAGVGVDSGFFWEVLQPAKNANDNAVVTTATMLDFSENIRLICNPAGGDKQEREIAIWKERGIHAASSFAAQHARIISQSRNLSRRSGTNAALLFYPANFSTARNDLHDFEAIAGFKLAMRKFRRRHGIAIVFHDHAAREKVLRDEKFFNRAGQGRFDWFAVGGDERIHGLANAFEALSKTISLVSPNARLSPAEVIVKRLVEKKANL